MQPELNSRYRTYLREKKPLTMRYKEIALASGLSYSYVSKLMNGHKKLTQTNFIKILVSFGYSYECVTNSLESLKKIIVPKKEQENAQNVSGYVSVNVEVKQTFLFKIINIIKNIFGRNRQ